MDEFIEEMKKELDAMSKKSGAFHDGFFYAMGIAIGIYYRTKSSSQAAKTDGCREGSTE